MADAKPSTAKQPATEKAPEPTPPAASAAASGDAGVQYLLARRQTAVMNGDADAVAEVDKQLAELGYK